MLQTMSLDLGPHDDVEIIKQVLSEAKLCRLIPEAIRDLVIEYRGNNNLFWSMAGNGIRISNHKLTVTQTKHRTVAVGNLVMQPNSGCYSWTVRVDKADEGVNRYIGVIRSAGLIPRHLNASYWDGCESRIIGWQGVLASDSNNDPCVYIGNDEYCSGSTIKISVDTDSKKIQFAFNEQGIESFEYGLLNCELRPSIGFGYNQLREQYTISQCYEGAAMPW